MIRRRYNKINVKPICRDYFHQIKGYEVGNFIMANPSLQSLSKSRSKPINVFFDSKHVESLYLTCPFIHILPHRTGHAFCTSKNPIRKQNESDYETMHRHLLKNKINMPHPYVDIDESVELSKIPSKRYIAIFSGCNGNRKLEEKRLPEEICRYFITSVLENNHIPVLCGSQSDYEQFWMSIKEVNECINYLGKLSLRHTVGIISQCDAFMSNDTGLYHAAGALNKPGSVLWKHTNLIKNKSPCTKIDHCVNPEDDECIYRDHIDKFMERFNSGENL